MQIEICISGSDFRITIDDEIATACREVAQAICAEDGTTVERETGIIAIDLKIVEVNGCAAIQYNALALQNELYPAIRPTQA